jgi:hypothetical protein
VAKTLFGTTPEGVVKIWPIINSSYVESEKVVKLTGPVDVSSAKGWPKTRSGTSVYKAVLGTEAHMSPSEVD